MVLFLVYSCIPAGQWTDICNTRCSILSRFSHFHVSDFPPLQHGAAFSCPASSCLAFSASPRKSQKHRLESDSSLESLTRVPNSAFLAHPVTTTTTTVSGEKSYKFEEILPIFKAVSSNPDNNPGTLAEFLEAFKTFDREGQGYINGAELRHVLKSLGTRGLVLRVSVCP